MTPAHETQVRRAPIRWRYIGNAKRVNARPRSARNGHVGILDHSPQVLRRRRSRKKKRYQTNAPQTLARIDAGKPLGNRIEPIAADVKPRHLVLGKIAVFLEQLDDTIQIALAVFEQRLQVE